MANSAGRVGTPNEGSTTDMGRGSSFNFPYSKGSRKTGRVNSGGSKPNPVTVDGNKRVVTDSRLTK